MKPLCTVFLNFEMQISSNPVSQGKRVAGEVFLKNRFSGKCLQGLYRLLGSVAAVAGLELLQNISYLIASSDAISLTSEQICRNLANLAILTGPLF